MGRPLLIVLDPVKAPGTSFVRPLLPALERQFEVRLYEYAPLDMVAPALAAADVLWVDWATEHAVRAAALNAQARKPLLVRLHSYEALDTDFVDTIDWTSVSVCVAVSTTILDIARERCPHLSECRVRVIENGIDVQRFTPPMPGREVGPALRIAWVGDLVPKKDPALALRIVADYLYAGGSASLHVAGDPKNLRVRLHMQDLVVKLGIQDAVHFDGVIDAMPEWLADKDVLLSTSMFESFGYAIGEALAVGLDAVVLTYPGAERVWPLDVLVRTPSEAIARLRRVRKYRWVDYVRERYALACQAAQMVDEVLSISATSVVPR